ncbi:hypothetical protein [Echinicola rosea]|uniref:Uncharacterized protein n=1 Tax=Echinicola rosea TaxID=1807691 RepID=A0ABQ1V1S4_9BACT|nr:hypothetical protein [Echinicola rosea]GGF31903.1 hypothetical protein GCM10011339_20140 [Echinicola rosea]
MKYPDEVDLMSFFECEPISLDSHEVPFFYNESTYQYLNAKNQSFTVKICPSYGEVKFFVKSNSIELSNIQLSSVSTLSILSDRKEEKRLMITSKNYTIKITLKPELQLELIEEKDI